MIKIAPDIFNDSQKVTLGSGAMVEQLGYPIKLAYTVIFIVQAGEADLQINFKNHRIKTHDILILSEDFITVFTRLSDDFKLFYCFIHRDFASDIAYQLPNSLFSYLHHFPLCRPRDRDLPLLQLWLTQLEYVYATGKEHRALLLKNHLQNFFLKIAESCPHRTTLSQQKYSRTEMLCWKFWDLISRHCIEHRQVAFYAEQLCISPFYLSQISKRFLNYTPKELINRQVILEIKALLRTTEIPIKVVAARLHFEDTSYLSRYFKQQTGMTLMAFRKK
ncbi:helix-turn-helix transcriptional regulator [Flavobacterium sp. JP2137]|uniref:helix-turn-helix transcriptional regulator n=1 Tax=Flavobacterium sp. JP2137 TaxID=3414510 RepID=UPI003D2FAA09